MSPILAAAVTGHEEIVDYLVDKMQERVDLEEAARALQLLGATFIDKRRNFLGAYVIWTRALTFRLSRNVPASNSGSCDSIEAYQNATEVTCHQQLDELFADPDAVRMQALLLRERVLGQAHPDTTYYIRYRGATYADSGRFDECLQLWRYALHIQQNVQQPLHSLTLNTLVSFAEIFSMMADDCADPSAFPAYEHLTDVVDKVIREIEAATRGRCDKDHPTQFDKILRIATHLTCVLSKFLPTKSQAQQFETRKKLFQLVSAKPVDSGGRTLLHIACDEGSNITSRYVSSVFPSVALVQLLCELGACARSLDNSGNTPLHVAAVSVSAQYLPDIAPLLLQSGAHLDQANHDGDTFICLLRRHRPEDADHYADLLIRLRRDNVKLTCLCARVIRAHRIPYHAVPAALSKFVATHYTRE